MSTVGLGTVALHDLQTGTTLASFKQTNAGPHCTAILESTSTEGGFVLTCQPDKSILNVYHFQKDQISLKIVLPEKLSCIAVDRRGDMCAGGTAQGRIYLWETSSGILYNSWDAHYRQVNVLRFTNDGDALISGSDDSGVNVWSVSRLLDGDLQNELPVPFCTLSDHTLPVTDIVCGVGLFPNCRLLTSSVDHSVKLWDISSKSLLTTFQFPQSISCLAWDITERLFFAASPNGSVHQMNLFRQRESKFGGQVMEALGGAGVTDIIRVGDENDETRKKRLISVGQPVSTLALSLASSLLLVGTTEGLIHIYDIPSHQLLRTISTHKGFSIGYLCTMLKPPDLIGHISLDFTVGNNAADAKDVVPVKPIIPFQRMRDAKTREAHDIVMLLPKPIESPCYDVTAYEEEEFHRDHAFFVKPLLPTHSSETDVSTLKSRVSELEGEVERLREHLGKAKGVNDAIWDTVVKQLVVAKNLSSSEDGDEELARKRSRI